MTAAQVPVFETLTSSDSCPPTSTSPKLSTVGEVEKDPSATFTQSIAGAASGWSAAGAASGATAPASTAATAASGVVVVGDASGCAVGPASGCGVDAASGCAVGPASGCAAGPASGSWAVSGSASRPPASGARVMSACSATVNGAPEQAAERSETAATKRLVFMGVEWSLPGSQQVSSRFSCRAPKRCQGRFRTGLPRGVKVLFVPGSQQVSRVKRVEVSTATGAIPRPPGGRDTVERLRVGEANVPTGDAERSCERLDGTYGPLTGLLGWPGCLEELLCQLGDTWVTGHRASPWRW